ncbi:thermonuclease family protein [Pararhizobium sp.]|uniref:thermonuclease family protein n=1 Tax=Pararhizobium sp. TaxID=1977563 RepID=UPI0027200607|nr:thermonuclease family protein [Pararhizobium sp.]MDO9418983.1 thermonuclease family protein [Pararhizobium sp.]
MTRFVRRLSDIVLTVAGLLLAVLIVLRLDMANEETVSGTVRVVDGDTLVLSGQSVRLAGIDAPELHQTCLRGNESWPCGREALGHLEALAAAGPVTCTTRGEDKYGRLLGVCRAGGLDLNAAMVSAGLAVAFGDYVREEAAARQASAGLWAGTFDLPKDWRARHNSGHGPAKGDASRAGFFGRLFHLFTETGEVDGGD